MKVSQSQPPSIKSLSHSFCSPMLHLFSCSYFCIVVLTSAVICGIREFLVVTYDYVLCDRYLQQRETQQLHTLCHFLIDKLVVHGNSKKWDYKLPTRFVDVIVRLCLSLPSQKYFSQFPCLICGKAQYISYMPTVKHNPY